MIQQRFFCVTAVLLAGLVVGTTSACKDPEGAVTALKGAAKEASALLGRQADAAEFSGLSNRLKGMIRDAPDMSGLSSAEKTIVDNAAQDAQALQEVAGMLGVADSIKDLINPDTVLLARGSFRQRPSEAFETKLDKVAAKILKDTTCNTFASEMNVLSSHPTFTAVPGSVPMQPNTNVYGDLTQALTDTNYAISQVQQYVDLSGLSSRILSTASGYVGKVKKTVTAAAWDNGGAARAYVHACVLDRSK